MRLACLATVALLLAAGPAPAQDTIDNPEFTSWSKFKKGTATTLKSTTTAAGNTTEVLIITTLVEVGADKLVVETETVVKAAGMEIKSPAAKRDVAKTIPLPKGAKKEDVAGGKPPGTTEEGTETVKVGGADVKTKWFKYKVEAGGNKTEAKLWTSDDVPGTLVKMETATTGGFAGTTKMELVEIKKP